MPGGGQAIKRSMRLQLRYDQQSASIAIPDLLGALMLKNAAWEVDKTARRDRHLIDAALLLSLIDSPDEEAKRVIENGVVAVSAVTPLLPGLAGLRGLVGSLYSR